MYLDHCITQKANWRKTWLQPLKEAPILPGDHNSQGSMRSFTVLILCLYSRSSHHRRWELYVTRIDSWCPLAPVSHFWLLKSPKVGVGQCAQGGIPVIHLWFLHWWGIGLEATCRSPREKWQCWDLPLILKGRVTVTYTWGRHSCAQCHQCRDLRESTIWGDWFPYLDCSNERRCFIQPTFNSGTFPTSSFWNIRTLGQLNAKDSMANTFGKCSILDPFPEFHSAHGPPRSLLKRKPVLLHLTHCAPQIHLTLDLIFSWILINIPWNSVLKGLGFRRQLLIGDTNCR